jgi:hypothetical protein
MLVAAGFDPEKEPMPKKKIKIPASVRGWVYRYLPPILVFNKIICLIFCRRSFLRQSGYIKSTALRRPIGADGEPIPWMNYNMVSFLEQRLKKDLSLFEYGSGNSTLFFAKRVKDVVSVENNKKWYDYCSDKKPANVELIFCGSDENGKYARAITNQEKNFDVVIVDGEDRVNCMITARDFLTPSGVIVLDDTQGSTTKAGIENLLEHGFRRLDFEGVKAGGVRFYRTTILYRDGNCFGI